MGIAAIWLLILSACSISAPTDLEQAANIAFKQIQAGDVEGLKRGATPAMEAAPSEAIAQLQAITPQGQPDKSMLLSYFWLKPFDAEHSTHELVHEYHWPDRVVLVRSTFERPTDEGAPKLHGIFVNVATNDELRVNDFGFANKSPAHYLMLLAVIAAPAAMIYAAVLAIRTPGVKRRWLWCLLSLVTIGKATLDWSTGGWLVQFIAVGLINVGVTKVGSFAPWMLMTTFPLGAILVIWRMQLRRRSVRKAVSTHVTPEG